MAAGPAATWCRPARWAATRTLWRGGRRGGGGLGGRGVTQDRRERRGHVGEQPGVDARHRPDDGRGSAELLEEARELGVPAGQVARHRLEVVEELRELVDRDGGGLGGAGER